MLLPLVYSRPIFDSAVSQVNFRTLAYFAFALALSLLVVLVFRWVFRAYDIRILFVLSASTGRVC
jgi:hypothetical protein